MYDLLRGARQLEGDRLFAEARRRADERGFTLLRTTSHVFTAFSADVAGHSPALLGPEVWWNDAPCDLFMRARGLARRLLWSEQPTSADCSSEFEQLRQQVMTDPRAGDLADLPLAFFGRGFSDAGSDPPRTGEVSRARWSGWPARWLYAPARLDHRSPRGHGTLLQLPIYPGDSALEVLERIFTPALPPQRADPDPRSAPADRELDAASWISLVRQARDVIRRGELAKVVLARTATLPAPLLGAETLAEVLAALTRRFGDCTTFSLRGFGASADEAFVAATPESLARLDGDRFRTVALAGTLPAGAEAEALLDDEKLREEQQIVTDELLRELGTLCTDLRWPERPNVRRLANVCHLETPISGKARPGTDLLSLVDALHPSAAVGGKPRGAALSWLRAHEGLDRGHYAAPVGWLDARGGGHAVVSLRCGLWRGDQLRAYVGAGITGDSDPAAEWAETEQKLAALATALPKTREPVEAPRPVDGASASAATAGDQATPTPRRDVTEGQGAEAWARSSASSPSASSSPSSSSATSSAPLTLASASTSSQARDGLGSGAAGR
jgi:isochorismate synthase